MRIAPLLTIALFCACSRQEAPRAAPRPEAIAEARALLDVTGKADPPKALALLEQEYGPAPAEPEAAFLLARAAFRSDQPAKCRAALDAYFARTPKEHADWTAEAWVLRGWLAEREGKAADALPDYEKALAVEPNYAFAMQRMGSALADAGDVAGAIGWTEKAIAQRPGLLEAHFMLAHLYRRAGRDADADREATIHKLLNQTSDNTANTFESVSAKFAAYGELETLLPQWIEGRITLAQMRLRLGRRELAIEQLRKLVAEHPDCDAAKKLLASITQQRR